MKSSGFYNSKIFKFFDYCFRLVLINLLIIVPAFLFLYIVNTFFPEFNKSSWSIITIIPVVLYFYPAILAGGSVIINYELRKTNNVFKPFFKALISFYKKSVIEIVILTVIVILFANSFIFFYNSINQGIIYLIGFMLTASFCVFILAILIHLVLVKTYMEGCSILGDFKLAGIMAFKDLGITIAVIVFIVFWTFLCVTYSTAFIIGGVTIPLYLLIKLTFKKYYIVYIRSQKDLEKLNKK